jgi:DNA mismatch repair protein MutL
MENSGNASQQSLFPETIELSPADHALVMGMKEEIRALGFDFDTFGSTSIIVNGVPADYTSKGDRSLFEGLLEQFKENKSALSIEVRENLARSLARRSSISEGEKLGQEEMTSIIDQLFACKNPNYGPDGRITFYILDLNKISNYFN